MGGNSGVKGFRIGLGYHDNGTTRTFVWDQRKQLRMRLCGKRQVFLHLWSYHWQRRRRNAGHIHIVHRCVTFTAGQFTTCITRFPPPYETPHLERSKGRYDKRILLYLYMWNVASPSALNSIHVIFLPLVRWIYMYALVSEYTNLFLKGFMNITCVHVCLNVALI